MYLNFGLQKNSVTFYRMINNSSFFLIRLQFFFHVCHSSLICGTKCHFSGSGWILLEYLFMLHKFYNEKKYKKQNLNFIVFIFLWYFYIIKKRFDFILLTITALLTLLCNVAYHTFFYSFFYFFF